MDTMIERCAGLDEHTVGEQEFHLKFHPRRKERRLSHEQRYREVDWYGPPRRLRRCHGVPVAGEVSEVVQGGPQKGVQGMQSLVS
jgi:hypothetical protein